MVTLLICAQTQKQQRPKATHNLKLYILLRESPKVTFVKPHIRHITEYFLTFKIYYTMPFDHEFTILPQNTIMKYQNEKVCSNQNPSFEYS